MNLIQSYLEYTQDTESPTQFHRWCMLSAIATLLGRRVYIPFGHGKIYPNMYVMLVGVPATRKSTAITICKNLLSTTSYDKFAYNKTSREKFLLDFEAGFEFIVSNKTGESIDLNKLLDNPPAIDMKLLLNSPMKDKEIIREAMICVDEFVDFIGQKNINFINTLTTLWDNLPNYPERLKNSKSVNIPNPTVNILGGITPTSFATAMPAEVVGQGFLSRIPLVYCDPTTRRITWPKKPNPGDTLKIGRLLERIAGLQGEAKITEEAEVLIDSIYQRYVNIPDARFQYYCARRLTHLLKMCMVIAASKFSTTITHEIVEEANTILIYTEQDMPKALGEFGEAKNASATQKIMELLSASTIPITVEEVYRAVSQDITSFKDLNEILNNLSIAKKIIHEGANIILNRSQPMKNTAGVNIKKYIVEARDE